MAAFVSVMKPDTSPTSAASPRGVPLGPLSLLMVLGSVALAAGAGYLLALWLGLGDPWVASLAAGLGMLLTALPLGAVLLGLARTAEPGPPAAAPEALRAAAMGHDEFMVLAEREWSRARRYGTGAALLVVEVDRFQRLVDRHGAESGEAVLEHLAQDITSTLRGADALARWADGQLAVFLAHADAMGALDVAERIRERAELLEAPFGGQRLRLTVSVGVAHLRPAHLHLQALVEDTGDAVAAARQTGGNCVRAAPVEPSRLAASGLRRNDHRAPKP